MARPSVFPASCLFNETLLPKDGPTTKKFTLNKLRPCHVIISREHIHPLPPSPPASFSPLIIKARKIFPSVINIFPVAQPLLKQIKAGIS